MLEVQLFFAMFLVQIVVMSVLYPVRLSRAIRSGLQSTPADRLAEHYPGVDVALAHERFLSRYRVVNAVVAALGVLLLGWFFSIMHGQNWDEGRVGGLLTAYFFLQNVPTILIAWFAFRFNKVHRRSVPESRRTATLQRRGLFDFVSPLTVALAVLSYAVFAAFMFYVARHPFPGFGGPLLNIGIVTLWSLICAFLAYRQIYGRKSDPIQTHANRMHSIRVVVNVMVWTCVLMPVICSLTVARQLLELKAWGPVTGTTFFLIFGLLGFRALAMRPSQPEADRSGSSPVHQ